MTTILIVTIVIAVAAVAAAAVQSQKLKSAVRELEQLRSSHAAELAQLRDAHTREIDQLQAARAAELDQLRNAHAREVELLRESHEQLLAAERGASTERFKALATEVLQANSRQFGETSVQQMLAALAPVKATLDEFKKDYRECYDLENRDRLSLREEIRTLHELNTRVGSETSRLTSALRGNTGVQGRWGEMVLANILEHSGLQQGRWLVMQESATMGDGSRLRPDAIIHCPRERDIIIDSKVSITFYLRMLETDNPDERASLLRQHLQAVEKQMAQLGRKEYQTNVGAKNGDFVLMFMPHEGAYLAAMNARPELWEKAYDNHVIIVSPTHLVTVVRLVEQMWQTEDTTVNAQKIADTAGVMLDQLNAFFGDLADLGKTLERATAQYENACKRLSTGNNNVVRVANRLQDLGIKTKKKNQIGTETVS